MRLLLVHHAWPPEGAGGSETYMADLAARLADEHEVAVLHRSADPDRPDHDLRERQNDGIRTFSLNNRHRAVPGFEAYRDPRVAAVGARLIDELRPEVVHVGHLAGLSTGLVFEARRRGAAVVITLHDFWPVCPLGQLLDLRLRVCPGPSPDRCLGCVGAQVALPSSAAAAGRGGGFGLGRLAGLLARVARVGRPRIARRLGEMQAVLEAADLLISPSRFLASRLAAMGIPRIEVLENGRPALEIPPRQPDPAGRVRFGFVGAALPSKGVHVLAEAYRRLDDRRAALSIHGPFLEYHGDTGYRERVRRQLGAEADEILRGPFPHRELGRVLAGLDVLVVPSLWEENAPLVVQEAFLSRLPLLVSGHGGLAERVRDGVDGLHFRPGDPAALATCLRRLLDDPELRSRLGSLPPPVMDLETHVGRLQSLYVRCRERYLRRPGRIGVVIVDKGRQPCTERAVRSAVDEALAREVVVVENGPGERGAEPPDVERLSLAENRGFAGGVNAGVARLEAAGCDRFLVLNNDAVLLPGSLRRLAEALDEAGLGAVGPTILGRDGRVESRGLQVSAGGVRVRQRGFGSAHVDIEGRSDVGALSGAAMMIGAQAWRDVGPMDEAYFHGFEDVDWCLRARRAGLRLQVVAGALVSHASGASLPRLAPTALRYAVRNHLRACERLFPVSGVRRGTRLVGVVSLHLAHVLLRVRGRRGPALRAVLQGARDHLRGRFGPLPEPTWRAGS